MNKILETERLLLREFELSDSQAMFDLNNDPEVLRWTGDPPFDSVTHASEFLEKYSDYNTNGYGRWAVIEKETGNFIGWCGLKLNEQNLIDLGYRFFQKDWGKGYATESARACLGYGFLALGMKEIIGRVARDNPASVRVLEKIGMTFWKEDACKGIVDSLYYKIDRKTYHEVYA